MRRRTPAVVAALTAVAVLLGSCTGVPSSSRPEVLGSGAQPSPTPVANTPLKGAEPRKIVIDFLGLNADSGDENHNIARLYLTPSERARWSDGTVTVIGDSTIGAADRSHTVRVDGPVLGTIDASGVYTPTLTGDGDGKNHSFVFQTQLVAGQWRISKLSPGLVVSSLTFQQQFQQRSIYFYDLAERQLVPDPRYTQLLDPAELANWLVRTLAAGPQDTLSGSLATEMPLPAQSDPRRVSVTVNPDTAAPVQIVLPGASQLDRVTRTRLATQVAATLTQVAEIGTSRRLTILDGTVPVSIPNVGTTFSADDFTAISSPPPVPPALYYINTGGGVVDEGGHPLPGRIGAGYYDLTSVALAADRGSDGLLVAGTRFSKGIKTLDIGSEATPLKPVPHVSGLLSRPTWAPNYEEAWIGDGPKLYRVTVNGIASVVPVTTTDGPAVGQILAVRFSPEGSRVAMVRRTTDALGQAVSQLWVGIVVRLAHGKVRVDGLVPVTATGTYVTDVAWNDELKLFAIGHNASTHAPGIYEVQCDGSRWSARGLSNLPHEPTTITIAGGRVAAVSSSGSVWRQDADIWIGPQGGDGAPGEAPVYVE